MEMEGDALGCGGGDDTKRDRTARSGDFDDTRAWRMIDREIDSPALRPRLTDRLGRFGLPWRDLRAPCLRRLLDRQPIVIQLALHKAPEFRSPPHCTYPDTRGLHSPSPSPY